MTQLCGFVVFAVSEMLEDHSLDGWEELEIKRLKHLFFIEEGLLYKYQYDAIADLMRGEIGLILQDSDVDAKEALHQVALQRALGLSYDQFVTLSEDVIRPIAERIIAPLRDREFVSEDEISEAFSRLRLLNTVIPLDPSTFDIHWSGGRPRGFGEESGRQITQDVKDAVWRRDQGRCALCGSQRRLEFDHIIPYSKGGASTYRNVQLLCELCNRVKSAALG